MKIAVDAFGGDNAPLSVIRGAHDAAREYGVNIILTGDKDIIEKCAADNKIDLCRYRNTSYRQRFFDMHDKPTDILKSKKGNILRSCNGSCRKRRSRRVRFSRKHRRYNGWRYIYSQKDKGHRKTGDRHGHTDYDRPQAAAYGRRRQRGVPPRDAQTVRNNGVTLSRKRRGIKDPEIGLLNIGTEDTKGGPLQIEAYKLLKESPVNFVGNIEARELPAGVCDAVISDGFTGNVVLKLYEGVASNMMKLIKRTLMSTFRSKIAALLAKKSLYSLKDKMNYDDIGGAPLLGVKKPVIKAHGSSNADAIKNAIRQAKRCAENDVAGKISADLQKIAADEKVTDLYFGRK